MYSFSMSGPRLARRFFRAAGVTAALTFSLILGSCAGLPPAVKVPSSGCRTEPLAGVYYPWRLHVIAPCVTVSGIVDYVKVEPDHDWHVSLKLDSGEPLLTNWVNRSRKNGDLVLEVIPMDQPKIPAPAVGEHITVTGAYVLDLIHGWREIHPVWRLGDHGSARFNPAAAKESVDSALHRN